MRHMTETMLEIHAKFIERDLLVPQYGVDEEMRKNQYHDMLSSDIREFVSFSACLTLDDMISKDRERDIDLEHKGKRKAEHGQTTGVSVKKPKGFYSRSRD